MKLTRKLRGPSFEKTAGKLALGDNPETYSSELLAHLYKQHSYLGKYSVDLSIEGQDDSMGYLYGVFLVNDAPNAPPVASEEKMGEVTRAPEDPKAEADKEKTSLRIPVIVENKKVYSFDVMITPDGKFLPLNEQRVAAALFNPSPYGMASPSVAKATPGGSANMDPNMPNQAYGSRGAFGSGKTASVLNRVAPSVDPNEIEKFLETITKTASLMDAAQLNEGFSQAIVKLASIASDSHSRSKSDEGLVNPDEFTAVVVEKAPGGYHIKMASAETFKQEVVFVPNSDAGELALDIRQDVIDQGHALLVTEGNVPLVEVEKTANLSPATDTAVYSVLSKTGTAQRAVVVNKVTSFDGKHLDLCLVVGKSGASLQEKVAGVRCGEVNLATIEGVSPRGDGVFLFKTAGMVSEPVAITNEVRREGTTTYLYDHPLFGTGQLKLASVQKPVKVGHNHYLIPESSTFIPLTFGKGYMSDETTIEKVASRHDRIRKVKLLSDGSEFSFSGTPVEKLASRTMTKTSALLLLALLGDTPRSAYKKLASAASGKTVEFVATGSVVGPQTGTEVDPLTEKIASVIRIDLTKEAASLVGSDTVDSVLSLNFVTPENIQGYIDSVPDLEVAASRLAELLVGVRLGLADVPETAVGSALRGIERALQGLKKLQIRSNAVG